MSIPTLVRLGAVPAAAAAITLGLAVPASAHVSGTPSDATAGAFTVFTLSVPHGCEGSPTTRIEIQVPESVLSVTPTRNPLWELEATITPLEEPVTDAHGNEVTERTSSIVYTADTPLPDGQRDTFELSFQVPDEAGETLAFPTIQTCEKGETGWIEVAAEGEDAHELEHPAPGFEILAASSESDHDESDATEEPEAEATTSDDSDALGWAGLTAGALGLLAGGLALARGRAKA